MKRGRLFWLIRRNNHLGTRRSPAFEQSLVAKVLMAFSASVVSVYLIVLGVVLAVEANEVGMSALVLPILPILLLIDFVFRFMIQQTPLMQIRPYILLPMPRQSIIEAFLLSSVFSWWNALWLSLFVPYLIITMAGGTSFLEAFTVLVNGIMLVMLNSQWYLLVRSLTIRSLLWWILPIIIYASYFVPLMMDNKWQVFETVADYVGDYGGTPLALLVCAVLLMGVFMLNRSLQFRFVYEELLRQDKNATVIRHAWSFSFLEGFGQVGQYLILEVKSIIRNKNIRSRAIMSISLVVVLSLLIAYTDLYDGFYMLNFWCYYCFAIYGMKIMGPEGNYIDMLIVQQRSILALLKAKYYFHCIILAVPFLLMLPVVIAGKFSWLMMLAYMSLTSGLLYGLLFQLAVYNKQTIALDQRLTGKGNVENGLQLILEMLGMFLPVVLVTVFLLIFDDTTAYLLLSAIGLTLTFLHPLWIGNVYRRMMKRKYMNLEGFHASR